MNLTNFLLLVIVAILVIQFYPAVASPVAVGGAAVAILYGSYWLIARYPSYRKEQRALREQHEADEREYWEHHKQHEAIRKKYDPRGEWNEATSLPLEYLEEIRAVNLAHGGMLQRRNGWTDRDFLPDD